MTETAQMEFFELGDKTALICADAETADVVRASLRDLGYKSHTAESAEVAVERIRYTQYNCIFFLENFAGSSLRSNAVLQYLSPLPMGQRRFSFVCLIGPSFKTMDAMQAFAHSVHLVVNPGDLPTFTAILKKSLAEFDQLYKVYAEALQ
jgi:hypothetical protein